MLTTLLLFENLILTHTLRVRNGVTCVGCFGSCTSYQLLIVNSLVSFIEPIENQTESLILAQNERWRRGLGMQVERESFASSFRTRSKGGKWRTGEEHVGNLPLSLA